MANFDRLKNIYSKNKYPILPIKPGMFLEIHESVGEGDTKRTLRFKGLLIKVKKPNHPDGTFTIRGEAARMTIEKIYPLSFPNFVKVVLLDSYKIRRSKLYYIRTKIGKDARFKSVAEQGQKGIDLLSLVKKDEKIEVVEEKVEEKNVETPKTEENKEEPKVEEKVEEVKAEEIKEEPKVEENKEEEKKEENKE